MLRRASDLPATAGPGGGTTALAVGETACALAAAAAALVLLAWLTLRTGSGGDWQTEAFPAVGALMSGHILRFAQLAPASGGSLVLRAPFVLVTKLWHGQEGSLDLYRGGAVPCLLAVGAFGAWLAVRMRARGSSRFAASVALLLCVANPLAFPAAIHGHPEEILGSVLCAAAVLCAAGDRPACAAVLLGLAIANKEWAVLAVGPVLVALPRARIRTLVIAGAVAGAVLAPLMLASGGGFVGQATAAGLNTGTIFQPWQVWWWFGSGGGGGAVYRSAPAWLGSLGHTVPIVLMPPLTALYAWRRPGRIRPRPRSAAASSPPAHHALLLLALLMGLRCVLDPWDDPYYVLPCLIALLTWEAQTVVRPPLVTLGTTIAAWSIFIGTSVTAYDLPADAQALVFAVVSIPLLGALALATFAPETARRLLPRSGRADAVPAGAAS